MTIYQLRPAGAGYGGGENKNNNEAKPSRKEPEMAYKKPQIVAKSAAKQTFVAGCGSNNPGVCWCSAENRKCSVGRLN